MKDDLHFLRVARSITTSRGARTIALPLVTTAVIGLGCGNAGTHYCGQVTGVVAMGCTPTTGAGGGATGGSPGQGGSVGHSSSTGHSSSAGHSSSGGTGGTVAGTGGAGGGPLGVMVMPDAGHGD
jgi:hypothetical protein